MDYEGWDVKNLTWCIILHIQILKLPPQLEVVNLPNWQFHCFHHFLLEGNAHQFVK